MTPINMKKFKSHIKKDNKTQKLITNWAKYDKMNKYENNNKLAGKDGTPASHRDAPGQPGTREGDTQRPQDRATPPRHDNQEGVPQDGTEYHASNLKECTMDETLIEEQTEPHQGKGEGEHDPDRPEDVQQAEPGQGREHHTPQIETTRMEIDDLTTETMNHERMEGQGSNNKSSPMDMDRAGAKHNVPSHPNTEPPRGKKRKNKKHHMRTENMREIEVYSPDRDITPIETKTGRHEKEEKKAENYKKDKKYKEKD